MPAKKSSVVPAKSSIVPARWKSLPPRRRKTILALAGVCVALIVLVIGQPSPVDTLPRVNAPSVDTPAQEPAEARPASRPRASRSERTETRATPVAATAATTGSEAATITGCLELDDDRFRLKDAEGEDAPKARSWKSGFLRRSNAQVDVVDAGSRLRLASHVGHRVSVTGMLADREIEARSLRMVAESCED